jgi:hypothetical protein
MNNPLAIILASLSMAISSGTLVHSLAQQPRQEIHLDPELERLALAYLQDQEEHRAYIRKVDEANRALERDHGFPLEVPPVNLNFSNTPKQK